MRFFVFFTVTTICLTVCEAGICAVSTSECSGDISTQTAEYIDDSLRAFVSDLPTDEPGECVLGAHGETRSDGISLQVKLVCEGKKTLEETRTVTAASAAAQARTMARNLLETPLAYLGGKQPTVKIDSLELVVRKPRYNRRVALGLSMWFTILPISASPVLFIIGNEYRSAGSSIAGIILASGGLLIGPSTGYFYLGRHAHGWAWAAGRLVMGAATAGIFLYGLDKWLTVDESEPNCYENEDDDCHGSDNNTPHPFVILGFASAALTLTLALIDAGLVGRAADKMNLRHRKKKKPAIVVAPTPMRTPSGKTVPGVTMALKF